MDNLLWGDSTPRLRPSSSILPLTLSIRPWLGTLCLPPGSATCVLTPTWSSERVEVDGDIRTRAVCFRSRPSLYKLACVAYFEEDAKARNATSANVSEQQLWGCNSGCKTVFLIRGHLQEIKMKRSAIWLTWLPTKRRCSPSRKSFSMSSITIMCCRNTHLKLNFVNMSTSNEPTQC